MTLFTFHGRLNAEHNAGQIGMWSQDVEQAQNGRFTFRDCNTQLSSGDVISFRTFVLRHGLGYRQNNGTVLVDNSILSEAVISPVCAAAGNSSSTGKFRMPKAELKILQPRGFEVSIAGTFSLVF